MRLAPVLARAGEAAEDPFAQVGRDSRAAVRDSNHDEVVAGRCKDGRPRARRAEIEGVVYEYPNEAREDFRIHREGRALGEAVELGGGQREASVGPGPLHSRQLEPASKGGNQVLELVEDVVVEGHEDRRQEEDQEEGGQEHDVVHMLCRDEVPLVHEERYAVSRAFLEKMRWPVMESIFTLSKGHAGFFVWDPFPILCTDGIFSAYDQKGEPIFGGRRPPERQWKPYFDSFF